MARIISKLQTEENVFEDEDDEAFLEDENGWTQESIGKQIRSLLCIEEERLAAPFWSGNMNGSSFKLDHTVCNIAILIRKSTH